MALCMRWVVSPAHSQTRETGSTPLRLDASTLSTTSTTPPDMTQTLETGSAFEGGRFPQLNCNGIQHIRTELQDFLITTLKKSVWKIWKCTFWSVSHKCFFDLKVSMYLLSEGVTCDFSHLYLLRQCIWSVIIHDFWCYMCTSYIFWKRLDTFRSQKITCGLHCNRCISTWIFSVHNNVLVACIQETKLHLALHSRSFVITPGSGKTECSVQRRWAFDARPPLCQFPDSPRPTYLMMTPQKPMGSI